MKRKICALVLILAVLCGGTLHTVNVICDQHTMDIACVHLSIDDSIDLFQDLTENKDTYTSAFDNPILHFLKDMHDQYGLKVSFYVFYDWNLTKDGFDLSKATDAYAQEFSENSHWLKFGFHAPDAKLFPDMDADKVADYYQNIIRELVRITGSTECIDTFVRVESYLGTKEMVKALSKQELGITGLLIADRSDAPDRESYGLTEEERKLCYQDDWYQDRLGMHYTPTDMRLEDYIEDSQFYSDLRNRDGDTVLTVFTHEWCMNDGTVRSYITELSELAHKNAIPFVFLDSQFGEGYMYE